MNDNGTFNHSPEVEATMKKAVVLATILFCLSTPAGAEECRLMPSGYPRKALWITLVGSNDAGVPNDAAAVWNTQKGLGYNRNLTTYIYPSNLKNELQPPRDLNPLTTHWVNVQQIGDLFKKDGHVVRHLLSRGISRPDIVLLTISSHGNRDGSIAWGSEEISLDLLKNIVENIHGSFYSPVVLFLDFCYSGSSVKILKKFRRKKWPLETFLIMSSISRQTSYALRFSEVWKHRQTIWPSVKNIPCYLKTMDRIFDQNEYYGQATIHFLAGILGGAYDSAGNGLDATDICHFLKKTQNKWVQPPISNPIDSRLDIVCESGSYSNPRVGEWSSKFAFFLPYLKIGIDHRMPPLISKDIRSVLEKFRGPDRMKTVFSKQTKKIGIENIVRINECGSEEECKNFDWLCRLEYDENKGFGPYCVSNTIKHVSGKFSPAIEDFERNFFTVAQRIVQMEWFKDPTAWKPKVSFSPEITLSVLLDRSGSMDTNDPESRMRRFFFDAVVSPALRDERISKFGVVSFADNVRKNLCFSRNDQNSIDAARRCFFNEIEMKGKTNITKLVDAAELLSRLLTDQDSIIWVLTDGVDTSGIEKCKAKDIGCKCRIGFEACFEKKNRTPCDIEHAQCIASASAECVEPYWNCLKELSARKPCSAFLDGCYKRTDYSVTTYGPLASPCASPCPMPCQQMHECLSGPEHDKCVARYRDCISRPSHISCNRAYAACQKDPAVRECYNIPGACVDIGDPLLYQKCNSDYDVCITNELGRLGQLLLEGDKVRKIYSLFFAGIGGNEAAIRQLSQLRTSHEPGRFVILNNQTPRARTEMILTEVGRSALKHSVERFLETKHSCEPDLETNRTLICKDEFELNALNKQSMLEFQWKNLAVRGISTTISKKSGNEEPLAMTCRSRLVDYNDNLSFSIECNKGTTQIKWKRKNWARRVHGPWAIRLYYTVTGIEQ